MKFGLSQLFRFVPLSLALLLCVAIPLIGFELGLLFGALYFAVCSLLAGRTIARRLAPLVCCIGLKIFLYQAAVFDYVEAGSFNDREELMARRTYLLEQVISPKFDENSMPVILNDFFKKEWAIVTLSMTTAAVTNVAFIYPETRADALEQVRKMIVRMLEPDIRAYELYFWQSDPLESLDSEKGQIGYLGHLNFMLGAYRALGGDSTFDGLHHRISAALARRMQSSQCIYLETFPGMIFVPDNMVVVASLQLYNRLYHDRYSRAVNSWLNYTRTNLIDAKTGLIAPNLSKNCEGQGVSRGSYAGWNSFYLPFIDRQLAESQYQALKQALFDEPLGIFGVREYPTGAERAGDIDSGPVVFGLSSSGTGFAAAGARQAGDLPAFNRLMKTAELAGTTLIGRNRRHYAFAPLVGEAIMLAMKTACSWETSKLLAADEIYGKSKTN